MFYECYLNFFKITHLKELPAGEQVVILRGRLYHLLSREFPSDLLISAATLFETQLILCLESLLQRVKFLGSKWTCFLPKTSKAQPRRGHLLPRVPSAGQRGVDPDAPCVAPAHGFSCLHFHLLWGWLPHFWPRYHKGTTSPVFCIHLSLVNAFLKYLIYLC